MNKGAFLTWKWHAFCVLTENTRKFQEIPKIPGNSSFADKNSSFADKIPVRTENSRNFQHFRVLTGAGVVSSARAKC